MLILKSKSNILYYINYINSILLLIFCISQGSVVTHLRCGGKYDTNF